jgi:hypothetical protein
VSVKSASDIGCDADDGIRNTKTRQ